MNVDVFVLTYNLINRRGAPKDRTEWGQHDLHRGYAAAENIFSRRTSEPLRLLNEDEVHFRCMIWLPDERVSPPQPADSRMKASGNMNPSIPTPTPTPTPTLCTPPKSNPTPPISPRIENNSHERKKNNSVVLANVSVSEIFENL